MIKIFNNQGHVLCETVETRQSEIKESLMADDYIELAWNSDSGEELPAGAHIVASDGERYRLIDPYTPEQKSEGEWRYNPQFMSRVAAWSKVPLFFYTRGENGVVARREPDWNLTDTAQNFISYIADAITEETGEKWTGVAASDLSGVQAVQFQSTDIRSGLNSIASAFETEWRADKKTNTLYLGKAMFEGSSVPVLEVGKNIKVPSITVNKEGYYNRFMVFGSTRNITQDYEGANINNLVNKRLTLDPAIYPDSCIDRRSSADEPALTKVLTFDEIYPKSNLVVIEARPRLMYVTKEGTTEKIQIGTDADGNPIYDQYAIWYLQLGTRDAGGKITPFRLANKETYSKDNPDGVLIAGKKLSAHFSSGALSGREFELDYKDSATTETSADGTPFEVKVGDFEIIYTKDNNYIIPAMTGAIPNIDDSAILFNLRMPSEYISGAYLELADAAMAKIAEYESDRNNYEFQSNPVAFADSEELMNLRVGQRVIYKNGDYSYETRILSITRKLDFPFEQTIKVGDDRIKGNTETLKEDVVNANKDINLIAAFNSLTQTTINSYNRAIQRMTEGFERIARIWYFGPDNPDCIFTDYTAVSKGDMVALRQGDYMPGGGGAGIDIAAVEAYLKQQGYATEQWVMGRGFLTKHQDISHLLSKSDAAGLYQPKGDYLTKHQAIYALTVQRNGVTVGTFTANQGAATINIGDVASAAALSAHAGDNAIHITAAERTKWDAAAANLASIMGSDSDSIINKWEEIVAFLDSYTEADTLAGLLGNKADKSALANYYTKAESDGKYALASALSNYYTKTEIDRKTLRYIHFDVMSDYLAARFDNELRAKKAADTYIEWWQNTGGSCWFNFALGSLTAHGDVAVDGSVKVGGGTIRWNNDLGVFEFSHTVVSDGDVVALNQGGSISGGGSGSGGLDLAALEAYLKQNSYATQTWVNQQGFLKSITKAAVESVLTGNVTSHTHSQYLTAHQSLANYYTKSESAAAFMPVRAYHFDKGCLVKLKIADTSFAMVTLTIKGNSYLRTEPPIDTIVQFYNYPTSDSILQVSAVHFGYDFGKIKVFCYNGYVYVHFSQQSSYQTFLVTAYHDTTTGNAVGGITNEAMPTAGVTRLVEVTPTKGVRSDNYASILDSRYALATSLSGYAKLQAPNNLVHNSNEVTMVPDGYKGDIHFNYRCAGGYGNGKVGTYHFRDGAGGGYSAVMASAFKVSGGTASQVLMADGSVQTHWKAADVTTATSDTGMITPKAMNDWTSKTFLKLSGGSMLNTNVVTNLNADLLDGLHKDDFNAVAHFGTRNQPTNGYYKIKIKSADGWMLGFKILVYQNYCFDEINISGYNYGQYYWHAPAASLVNSQGNNKKASIEVKFGYDSARNLWVAIPAAYYAGIAVTDVTNGYTQVADRHRLFEIVYEETLTGSVQSTVTAACHALLTDNVASATKLATARTLWGQSFNGSANVSGTLSSVTDINMSGSVNIGERIKLGRIGNYLELMSGGNEMRVTMNGSYSDMYINYNVSGYGGSVPKNWIWNAGSIDTYANFILGNLTSKGLLKSVSNGVTVSIGAENTAWAHFRADKPFWFSNGVNIDGNLSPYKTNSYNLGDSSQRWLGIYGKNLDLTGGLTFPYAAGTWLSMATRSELIQGAVANTSGSAHAILKLRNVNGSAWVIGGLGVNVGIYGFSKALLDAGTNNTSWSTIWDVDSGELRHSGKLRVLGLMSAQSIWSDGEINTATHLNATGHIWAGAHIEANGDITSHGNITADGDVTALSDRRVKSEIRDLEFRGALRPRIYVKDGRAQIGFVAQEVAEIYPELVHTGARADELWRLSYGQITAVLAAQCNDHERRLRRLERMFNVQGSMFN